MPDYAWYGLLILLIAIGAVVGVCVWSSRHSCSKAEGRGAVLLAADDVQTGDLVELVLVTGSTGAASETGFVSVLAASISTPAWSNRLYCNVSASTSMAVVDASGGLPTGLSSEFATIDFQVLVDGAPAVPGTITFNSVAHVVGTELAAAEALALADGRSSANAFQFVARDLPPGAHSVSVLARAVAAATGINAAAAGVTAVIGSRSLVLLPASTEPGSSSS
jgi:hypothetical protein